MACHPLRPLRLKLTLRRPARSKPLALARTPWWTGKKQHPVPPPINQNNRPPRFSSATARCPPAKFKPYCSVARVHRKVSDAQLTEWISTSLRVRTDADEMFVIYLVYQSCAAALNFPLPASDISSFVSLFGKLVDSFSHVPPTPFILARTPEKRLVKKFIVPTVIYFLSEPFSSVLSYQFFLSWFFFIFHMYLGYWGKGNVAFPRLDSSLIMSLGSPRAFHHQLSWLSIHYFDLSGFTRVSLRGVRLLPVHQSFRSFFRFM